MPKKSGGIIFDDSKNNIIIVQNKKTQKWSIPKGSIEEGENLVWCAQREIYEETGLKIDINENSPKIFLFGKEQQYFIIKLSEQYNLDPIDTREINTVKWFPIAALSQLDPTNLILRMVMKKFNKIIKLIPENENSLLNKLPEGINILPQYKDDYKPAYTISNSSSNYMKDKCKKFYFHTNKDRHYPNKTYNKHQKKEDNFKDFSDLKNRKPLKNRFIKNFNYMNDNIEDNKMLNNIINDYVIQTA